MEELIAGHVTALIKTQAPSAASYPVHFILLQVQAQCWVNIPVQFMCENLPNSAGQNQG